MSFVVEYLEQERAIRARMSYQLSAFHYKSAADFLLQHGQMFDVKKKPKGIRFGKVGECYRNAFTVVNGDPDRFEYVEGYAEGGIGFPVQHAFVLDREDGKVFDVTWRPTLLDGSKRNASDYFGVVFPYDEIVRIICDKGTYGALGYPPLYREPWEFS